MEMLAETPASEDRPTDLVGVRDCAKHPDVKVHASTISRQLASGLFKNWGTALKPLVSIAEVKSVRAAALDPAQQRRPAARTPRAGSAFHESRAAREDVNRQIAELDLAERLGQVVDKAQVNDDFETFARALREGMRQRAQTVIMEMDGLPNAAAKVAHLIEADEKLLAELAGQMETIDRAAREPKD